jgi:hypothetical protein
MAIFNTSIYYKSNDCNNQLTEFRFLVDAQTDSEAQASARATMRDDYVGEADDSKYLGGISYAVPGATTAMRLPARRSSLRV